MKLLLCVWASLWALDGFANHFLVWGQAHNRGFAFTGRAEDIRNQCTAWMANARLTFVSSLRLMGKQTSFRGYDNEACQHIFKTASRLGNSQKQFYSVGVAGRFGYSFTGRAATIIDECQGFLRAVNVERVRFIISFDARVDFEYQLQGREICGAVVSRGREVKGPFVQYYVTGSLRRKGFAFVGNRERFFQQCKAFIVAKQLFYADDAVIHGRQVSFGKRLWGHGLCDYFFATAIRINDPEERYEAHGRIRNRGFWFVGTVNSFVASCVSWVNSDRIKLEDRLITGIQIGGVEVRPKENIYGVSFCGLVLKRKKKISKVPTIRLVSGSIRNKGFSWSGSEEEISQSCQAFILRNNLRQVSAFTVRGAEDSHVRLSEPLSGGQLCAKVTELGILLEEPASLWTWEVTGRIQGERFHFRGDAIEFFRQCNQFFSSPRRSLRSVAEFESNGNTIPIRPAALGPEACFSILVSVPPDESESYVLASGRVGNDGYSIAFSKPLAPYICRETLGRLGVGATSSFVIFDELIQLRAPVTGVPQLCTLILQRAIEFDNDPDVDVEGKVDGKDFKFKGKMTVAHRACVKFVSDKGIIEVEDLVVNDKKKAAPLGFWRGQEICGVIFREGLQKLL